MKSALDRRRCLRVRRPRGETDGQTRVHVARPVSREDPPRHVHEESLAETVVAGQKVQAAATRKLHFRSEADISEFQAFKHIAFTPFAREHIPNRPAHARPLATM